MTGNGYLFPVKLLVIAGPTASGKTAAAVDLAHHVRAELVGADSMQVYRGMDIGTATPTPFELQGIVHHLINMVNPDETYDAARFCADADAAIADIHRRGLRVVVVGGTGMYLRMLLRGMQGAPPPDPDIRAELERRARQEGWPALHGELAAVDAPTARRLHPNDGVRIVRALEVWRQTGRPISSWQAAHGFATPRYEFRMVGLAVDKDELARRIERRVAQMMADGFVDEVEGLLAAGYAGNLRPLQGLGYRRIVAFLEGRCTKEEAVQQIVADTRRFARRQRNWFRSEPVHWLETVEQVREAARGFF